MKPLENAEPGYISAGPREKGLSELVDEWWPRAVEARIAKAVVDELLSRGLTISSPGGAAVSPDDGLDSVNASIKPQRGNIPD